MTDRKKQPGLKPWVIMMVAFIDDVVVVGVVFGLLWVFDVEMSVAGIIAIGLVLGTFTFIVHRALVPVLRRKRITGAEGMVGQTGVVSQCLKPDGMVLVQGEYWQACCRAGEVGEGEEVEITGIERLKLEVKRKP